MTVRSKHNNLLNYFLYDNKDLSTAYIKSCDKFFKEIETNNKEYKRKTKIQEIREGVYGRIKQRTQFKKDKK
jgi:hypothetical protein